MASHSHCRTVPIYLDPSRTPSPHNPSFFYPSRTKRHRFASCSLHRQSQRHSPSPVTSSSGHGSSKPVILDANSDPTANDEKSRSSENPTRLSETRTRSFTSVFGFRKRYLWRRILLPSRKVRSIILLNVITFIYASNIPVVKEVQAIMNPAAFTFVRFALSAIPFIPFVLRGWGDSCTRNAGMELGLWVSLGYLMQALGLQTSDAGRASFLSMFTVIVVPLLDGLLGAVVPARTWFGALISIVGVGMLESSGSSPCVGDLLNFLSAVFFGVHMLRTEHISRSISKEKFLPLLGFEICIVVLFSTIWYLLGGSINGAQHPLPSSLTWKMLRDWMVGFPWIPAIYTGIFSTGLCLWVEIQLQMAAMCDVSATETAMIYGLEPVWGAGFAWFLLGERWGSTGWIGAALVLGGSLTVQIFGTSSNSNKEQKRSEKGDNLMISDKKNGLSTSTVILRSRTDASDFFK
ncbi:membrane protein [Spatholobus suberectus]|nr:membrane protein [Spatholobus suberectus]